MMGSPEDRIAELHRERAKMQAEIEQTERLTAAFPDLVRNVDRWKRVRYSSASVNTKVDDYEMGYNCGCCNDSPLEIRPYIKTEHGRVYSNPCCFRVGEKDWWAKMLGRTRNLAYAGWDKEMRNAGIPEAIIQRVALHLDGVKDDAR